MLSSRSRATMAALGLENVALRGAKLKNTEFMYGCVIYTGQGRLSQRLLNLVAFFNILETIPNLAFVMFSY